MSVSGFGTWKSPITAVRIASGSMGIGPVMLSESNAYWTESRPAEGGRMTLMRRNPSGELREMTPNPFSVRTRVHEYGGGAYFVNGSTVYFSNFSDQRLYRIEGEGAPTALTEEKKARYADGVADSKRVIMVREDHSKSSAEPVNELVTIDKKTGKVTVLVSGADFYAAPRLSPDGKKLAWVSWNHPNMPWDSTELWVGDCQGESIVNPVKIAGQPGESVLEPLWSHSGILHFASDSTGWWNLYFLDQGQVKPIHNMEAEFSGPLWNLGLSSYGFISEAEILCSYVVKGRSNLGVLDRVKGTLDAIETDFTEIRHIKCEGNEAFFVAGSPSESTRVIHWDNKKRKGQVCRSAFTIDFDPEFISEPLALEFPTANGLMAHGYFYPPQNPHFQAPPGEKPPLLVISHGGPTGHSFPLLTLNFQFWTTRGFAVLDVNYGGSTGFGTEYRRRLNGTWGIVDVQDCVNGGKFLAEQGLVDGERLVIRGGSAGGFTTLCALTFHDVFKAGASYYGVSDIELLLKETHKFESRYESSLVGPYPERRDLYVARSPIYSAKKISCPLLLLQGLEDKVVPPNQAELMYEAVKSNGIPVAYLAFEGEDHGFRKKENIQRSLEAELYFYSRVFKFRTADLIDPIPIDNL